MTKRVGENDYDWGFRVGFSDEVIGVTDYCHTDEWWRGYERGKNAVKAIIEEVVISIPKP
jgi:hypothetical protein